MRKWAIILSSIGLAGIVMILVCFVYLPYKWNKTNRSYIERITSIRFPTGTETIETMDDAESRSQGKFKLRNTEVDHFIKSNPFDTLDNWNQNRLHQYFYLLSETLRPTITDKTEFLAFEDCKPGNRWIYLIKIKTGELWVEVQYPDWGGFDPGCNK